MKFAYINEQYKILGWYDLDIHSEIPSPNIEVSDEVWQNAIDNNHNRANEDGTTELFDFRNDNEKLQDYKQQVSSAIQIILDDTARKTDWDNMMSARATAGIPLFGSESSIEIAMHNDAVRLSRWYLSVWGYVAKVQEDVLLELRETPSIEQLISELPVL